MAKKIEAYESEDGSIHLNECEAVKSDLEMMLNRSPMADNRPYMRLLGDWLAENAGPLSEKLAHFARVCPKPALATVAPARADHAPHCQSNGNADLDCDCGGPNRGEDEDNGR